MNNILKHILNAIIVLLGLGLTAQNTNLVKLKAHNIAPSEYLGDIQVWDTKSGGEQEMFFATSTGISVWDGSRWEFFTGQGDYLRCLYYDHKTSNVYSGGDNSFGVWERDNLSNFNYRRLYHNRSQIDNQIFWRIEPIGDDIFFQTHQRIFVYNTKTELIDSLDFSGRYVDYIHRVADEIWVQVDSNFYRVDKNLKCIELGFQINNRVVGVFKKDSMTYFITEDLGIMVLEKGKISPLKNSRTQDQLTRDKIFSVKSNSSNGILIGTVLGGFYLLRTNGEIEYNVSIKQGLSSTTVLCVNEDNFGNVWVGLDGGISKISQDLNEHFYTDIENQIGNVYAVCQKDGLNYIGTNKGLYVGDNLGNVALVHSSQGQVWNIRNIEGTLYVMHDRGIFTMENGKMIKTKFEGAWDIIPFEEKKGLFISVNYSAGFSLYRKDGQKIDFVSKLQNKLTGSYSTASVDKYGYIWSVNKLYQPIRIQIDTENNIIKRLDTYVIDDSFGIIGMFEIDKEIVFFSKDKRAHVFDPGKNDLVQSEYYGAIAQLIEGELLSLVQRDDELYCLTERFALILKRQDGKFYKKADFFERMTDKNIPKLYRKLHLTHQGIALGAQNGIAIYNFPQKQTNSGLLIPKIKRLKVRYKGAEESFSINDKETVDISANYEHIMLQLVGYSSDYLSIGVDGGQMQTVKFEDVIPLPHLNGGKHKIRLATTPDTESVFIEFELVVHKKWYLSILGMTGILLGILLLLLLIFTIYAKRIALINAKRMRKSQDKLERQNKELESKMLKMQLVEKDKKLANLTFNGINRNKLINEIKEEAENLRKDPSNLDKKIQTIVRKLDSHINSKEDWLLFEKYFNNIYDGFFDRMLVKYPDLTQSELKLAAYIKLNLSIKEIAALSNISMASVEVARYRLRKKMGLNRGDSMSVVISQV